ELTRASGIIFSGLLDGNLNINALTGKTPGIESDLKISDLKLNETLIGNLKFLAELDNEKQEADINLSIAKSGFETLNVHGIYNLFNADNNLNFSVKLNQT